MVDYSGAFGVDPNGSRVINVYALCGSELKDGSFHLPMEPQ